MSLGLGATFGVGATDVVRSRLNTTISNNLTIFCWYYKNGLGGGNLGRICDCADSNALTGYLLQATTNNTTMLFTTGSGGAGTSSYNWQDKGLSNWQSVCLVESNAGTGVTPTVYVNGASVSVATGQAAGVWPAVMTSPLNIGNRQTTANRVWDGMIAHFAVWNGTALSAIDAQALAGGLSPLFVRPAALSIYLPLDGMNSPEFDLIRGNSALVTGGRLGTSDPLVMPYQFALRSYIRNRSNQLFLAAWAARSSLNFGRGTAA